MKTKIFILSLFFLLLNTRNIHASSNRFVSEINNVKLDENSKQIVIEGWAFIADAQNYLSDKTHGYTLILKSKNDEFQVSTTIKNINQTDLMWYAPSPACRDNQYNVDSLICNHKYENVGFSATIPLNKFKMDQTYEAYLKIDAKQAKVSQTAPVYYATKNIETMTDKHHKYSLTTLLDQMKFTVDFSHVLVRTAAGKASSLLVINENCSVDKAAYFKINETFNKVFNKKVLNNTTFYETSGQIVGCEYNRGIMAYGSKYSPIWIASTFIKLQGNPLTIKTEFVNNAPILNAPEIVKVNHNETFDPLKNVFAYDAEDGDLTDKIKIVLSTYKDVPGEYLVFYSVTDSQGLTSRATSNVLVLERNYPPSITASDIEVRQHSSFNPLMHARAHDNDGIDISDKLKAFGTVDTSILGDYQICYQVFDKNNLEANKCINVKVVKNNKGIRFISKTNLFYREAVPIVWINNLDVLEFELSSERLHANRKLNK